MRTALVVVASVVVFVVGVTFAVLFIAKGAIS